MPPALLPHADQCDLIADQKLYSNISVQLREHRNIHDLDDYRSRKGIPALPFSTLKRTCPKIVGNKQFSDPKTLGDHMSKRRLELGLQQKEVAALLGVCEDSITGWENGRSEPHVHYYPKIIAFLGYYPFSDEPGIPGRIKKHRFTHGLTQKQFGKKVGVDGSTVSDWENRKTEIRGKYLKNLKLYIKI